MPEPITRRGKVTKGRVVGSAAALMYQRGVSATSIVDIPAASETGKSQLYHYFSGKESAEVPSLLRGDDLGAARCLVVRCLRSARA